MPYERHLANLGTTLPTIYLLSVMADPHKTTAQAIIGKSLAQYASSIMPVSGIIPQFKGAMEGCGEEVGLFQSWTVTCIDMPA